MAKKLKYPLTREEILGIKDGSIAYSAMKEKYGFHYTIYRNIKLGLMKGYEALLNESLVNTDGSVNQEAYEKRICDYEAKQAEECAFIPEDEASEDEASEDEASEDEASEDEVSAVKTEPRFIKKRGNARVEALLGNAKKVSFLNGDIYYIPRNGKIERFMYKKESGVSLEQALINAGFLK